MQMFSALLPRFFDNNGTKWETLVVVCTDSAAAVFGSRSGFSARMQKNSPNAVQFRCVNRFWSLGLLSTAMKDKLVVIIRNINFVKTNAVNTRLLAKLLRYMDFNIETLPFQTFRSAVIRT